MQSSATTFIEYGPQTIDHKMLAVLKKSAEAAPLARSRYCLHSSPTDAVQSMVIAHSAKSYDRPHRHQGKSLSILIIEGEMDLLFFTEQGNLANRISMASNSVDAPFLVRIADDEYFSCLPTSPVAVIFEVIEGPFSKSDSFYPPWAPEQGEPLATFLESFRFNPL